MKTTHFTEKAWLITWERTDNRSSYSRQYGIYGIYNDKNLAEIAINKLKKESNNSRIDYELQEVGLNEYKELFAFYY